MKKIYLLLCLLTVSFILCAQNTPDFSMLGFATLNGGTTGGNAATEIIEVRTAAELTAAIGGEKTTTPRIIKVIGTISNSGKEIPIKNCANITIFGADENAFIYQTPIIITNSSNIIIRNLKFTMTGQGGGKDIMEITTTSSNKCQNIWIDHCEFYNETPTAAGAENSSIKDKYDGLLDIKKNSEYITISWCYFHDHYKAILVGFTAGDTEDRKITMHHNRFERINSRIPSYRGGTAHIYNNYFEGWIENGTSYGNCIHTQENCNLLVENNYFTKLSKGVYWDPNDAKEGFATGTGNIFTDDVNSGFTSAPGTNPFLPPYTVNQHEAIEIPELTKDFAGVGIITSYDDYGETGDDGNKAPYVNITSPSANESYEAPAEVKITVEASDEDGSISKVEIYKNNELMETLESVPYEYTFTGLMSANYYLTARAYDDKGRFSSHSVLVSVKSPQLVVGKSIFGTDAPLNDYFWFDTHPETVKALMTDGTFSGDIKYNTTAVEYTNHKDAIVVNSGGSIIFNLPGCALFKLYLTRTGSFGGSVYASIDGVNWGDPLAGISGSSGIQEVDYTHLFSSAQRIYIKIHNTSSGGLNIHGANIRLSEGGSSSVEMPDTDKNIIAVKYYSISGMVISRPEKGIIYIQESVYDDGSVERIKYMER